MSDTTYETFQHYGTNAARLAFTPNPAAGITPIYIWYETDTNNVYVYTTAWHLVSGSSGGGGVAQSSSGIFISDIDEDDIGGEGFPIPGPPGVAGSSGASSLSQFILAAPDVLLPNGLALSQIILRGTRAAQPAANTLPQGALYYVTDEGVTEFTSGAAWLAYSGTGGASASLDYLTFSNESADLPNSRNVVAGTNIAFDDSVANQRTISASGAGIAWTTVFKTSDQSKASDTTRVADPVLKVTLAASTKYSIRGMLFVTAGAGGFFGKFSGPASPTLLATMRWVIDGTGAAFSQIKHDSAYAQDFSTATDCMMRFEVLIHNGANAGDFTIDWAQGTTDVTNTTMRAGSYIEYHTL